MSANDHLDMFAAAALQGLLAGGHSPKQINSDAEDTRNGAHCELAALAYEIADSMIIAREMHNDMLKEASKPAKVKP